jgi:hypothetical protein
MLSHVVALFCRGASILICHLLTAACLVVPIQLEPTTTPASRPALAEGAAEVHTLPPLSTRPYANGLTTEAEYDKWLSETAASMVRDAQGTEERALRIERLLAAANFILARRIEPAATRYLLQIPERADRTALASAVAEADPLLEEAAAAVKQLEPSDELKAERIEELERTLRTLEAFARALGAIAASAPSSEPTTPDEDELHRVRRKAAAGLAPSLEDTRPLVVAAATLWQSVLYGLTDELDRAMRLLPLTSKTFGRATAGTELFVRLQRCRYVARQGGYAAAIALLLGLEEQCVDAFAGDARKDEAVRAVALVRIQTLEQWEQALPTESETERTWCRQTAAAACREHFADEADRAVLRLEAVIPVIASKDAVPATAPTKEPPSKPPDVEDRDEP